MPSWFWLAIVVVAAATVLVACLWVFAIRYQVIHSPRQEMFECQYHGPILKDHLIWFLNEARCPRCFHERLQWAETMGKKGRQ